MNIKEELQLIEDLESMKRKISRGWVSGHWSVGFIRPKYCLAGAMNKTIIGVAHPVADIPYDIFDQKERRIDNVLKALGFGSRDTAERWNDTHRKEDVLNLVHSAVLRIRERVEKEQLRLTKEAAAAAARAEAAAAKLAKDRCFVQEWLDKPREEPLVVPEVWPEPVPIKVEEVV